MCHRVFFTLFLSLSLAVAQQTSPKPAEGGTVQPSPAQSGSQSRPQTDSKSQTPLAPPAAAEKAADYSQQAFVIEKYLTRIRFENDGTSEREQITRIRVLTQAGVQVFGQLHFPYNAANDKIDIVSVKVIKPNGAVTAAGPESVQDLTAPVAREAPIYSDLHQKDVVVPGLAAGDILEYDFRVKEFEPLAPGQFWDEHQFISKVIVLDEQLQVDVPAGRELKMRSKSVQPEVKTAAGRTVYLWKNSVLKLEDDDSASGKKKKMKKKADDDEEEQIPDVQLSTFHSWGEVGRWYSGLERDRVKPDQTIRSRALELTASAKSDTAKVEDLYDFVAPRYRYVGISFGVGRFQPHSAIDVLNNRYGDCKDKHTLLASLIKAAGLDAYPVLIHHARKLDETVPSPAQFDHVITFVPLKDGPDKAGSLQGLWLDSTTEVAPFRMLVASIRNKKALLVPPNGEAQIVTTPADLPTANMQSLTVTAKISQIGKLEATYDFTVRGDAELAFRVAFRGTPQAQWKRVVEYLNSYQGLAGDVDDVKISDPSDTHHALNFSYKLTQANYLDWTTKTSQLAIPLPRLDMSWAAIDDDDDRNKPYEFPVAPLESHETVKIELPDGYNYRPPVPINVKRDYATYSSDYKLEGHTLTVTKDLVLSKREIAATRGSDLRAFVRNVTADGNQSMFVESLSATSASSVPAGMSADDLNEAGIAALKNQNFRAASELLKRVVELEPKHKDAWNNLGRAYLALVKYDDAIAAFKKQIEINPFDEYAYNNLGLAYQSQEKYDDAIVAYKKQLEVNPLDPFAPGNLGSLYLEQKKYNDAVSELERAVQVTPQNPGLEANLGRAYLNVNQPDKALAAFDKAVELAPSPGIWNNVAYELSTHRSHLDKALTYAESATSATEAGLRNVNVDHLTLNDVGLVMSIGSYWDTLGWVYFQNNQFDRAKRYIEAAWLLDEHSEIGDHLGQLYEKLGRRQDAIRFYAMAATANHKIPEAEQHLKALVPNSEQSKVAVEKARAELEALRSARLPWSGKDAKAEFFVTFTAPSSLDDHPLKPDQVKFVSGDESLRAYATQLQAASFHVQFPDDTPIKLVRRGVLTCTEASRECRMVLMFPEDVRTVD